MVSFVKVGGSCAYLSSRYCLYDDIRLCHQMTQDNAKTSFKGVGAVGSVQGPQELSRAV
jgi:hypothetical protein